MQSRLAVQQIRTFTGLRTGVNVRTLTNPIPGKTPNIVSADEALAVVQSGDNVYIHCAPSTPTDLLKALARHVEKNGLSNVRTHHLLTTGEVPWTDPKFAGKIRSNCFFVCSNLRPLVNTGKADYTPIFLQDTIKVLDDKVKPVDVSLVTVSPPDSHGYCSIGVNVDMASAACRNAKYVIGAMNKSQPKTFGDTFIHASQFHALVETDVPLPEVPSGKGTPEEAAIGKLIAENLVDDYATLQLGIGSIPDNVLKLLIGHKDIGIHTELLCTGVMSLIEAGVVTNSRKSIDVGKCVTSFAMGNRKFYDLLNDNTAFVFASAAYTNNFNVIAAQSRMTAINSAIEIDLAGQIVSDTIGKNYYSGFGGQVDFINAAAQAADGKGKAIIALPSRTHKGQTKIVPYIKEGAGVVTTRAHTHYVVTEFGIANLFGKSVRQRAYELIKIAHPDDREALDKAAFARFGVAPSRD